MKPLLITFFFAGCLSAPSLTGCGQVASKLPAAEKVIIDTDIGDDIDDAFAVVLALRSPELQVLGMTTTFGDTKLRARLLDRLLADTGHSDIPVAAGTPTADAASFSQRPYAEARNDTKVHEDAVPFLMREINQSPGEITLIAIGPLFNVGAMIDKDLATFRKLKRVVIMGGAIDRGYGDHATDAEWNIVNDPVSAQKLMASGVPVFVFPLDSTQIKLDDRRKTQIFQRGISYTDALTLLSVQWGQGTPTLFDPMTIAWMVQPSLCPTQPIRLRVDTQGYTRREAGEPNAQVCLASKTEDFLQLFMSRLLLPVTATH